VRIIGVKHSSGDIAGLDSDSAMPRAASMAGLQRNQGGRHEILDKGPDTLRSFSNDKLKRWRC
jgi:hypothetical protein